MERRCGGRDGNLSGDASLLVPRLLHGRSVSLESTYTMEDGDRHPSQPRPDPSTQQDQQQLHQGTAMVQGEQRSGSQSTSTAAVSTSSRQDTSENSKISAPTLAASSRPAGASLPTIPRKSPQPQPQPPQTPSVHISVPRKKPHGQQQQAEAQKQLSGIGISVKSETPFKLRVTLSGVPLDRGGIPKKKKSTSRRRITLPTRANAPAHAADVDYFATTNRTSTRTPKRKLTSYDERGEDDLEDTDSELSVDDRQRGRGKKRSLRKVAKKKKDDYIDDDDDHEILEDVLPSADAANDDIIIDPNQVEAPPAGVLSSLWYSRECVLHIMVVDKILGWKTRPVVTLEYDTDSPEPKQQIPGGAANAGADSTAVATGEEGRQQKVVDPEKATKWSAEAVAEAIADPRARMEISRINASHCPEVIKIAALKEERRAQRKNTKPEYVVQTSKTEREEVVLVKWRGRSYLHASWERLSDLEALDPTKTTAKSKIKRYMQSQEAAYGWNWKATLEKERSSFHEHGHGSHAREIEREDKYAPTEEEEFFPPDYVEVERILASDESEMNMDIFPKQRALNALAAEREALLLETASKAKSGGQSDTSSSSLTTSDQDNNKGRSGEQQVAGEESDDSWDPEDYVRYVVKYKGLPLSDITWEYWLHLKNDCVDQAEDFWCRQYPPSPNEVKKITSSKHPTFREFRKMKESPVFGIPSRKRKIAQLDDHSKPTGSVVVVEDDEVTQNSLKLREYQLEGVNWLLWNWWNRRSCILADEMGLGKTIQSVTFLDRLMRMPQTQVRGPFLVVAPLSLVNQWQSETSTWAPDMNLILYHGSADARHFLVQQEFYYTDQFASKATAAKLKRQNITKCHIVVTTYEVVLKDIGILSKIRWKALIVDECQRLKNAKSRLFEDLGGVPRDFCVLLTGTPLQNSTEELWALLHFADPVTFASRESFIGKFGQLSSQEQVSDLHKVLKPYLLRRVKEDVEKSLPPKEETILEVTLTPIQKTYYKAIYEKNTTFLFKGTKSKNAPSLMNAAMELRKCCNHPFLIGGAEERILADAAMSKEEAAMKKGAEDDLKPSSSAPVPVAASVDWKELSGEQLIKSSGKMVLLDKLLPKLQSGGHKVLIFSQMVRVLDLLEDLLRLRDYKFERLDGSRSASSRSAAVDRFNKNSFERFIMLLSTRAGGLGLNLVSADTVIIYDSDWNPQNDLQAMARAHRIGQTRAVSVYRLLTSKTYEMHMFNSASMKLGLDRAVLAQQRANEEKSKSKRTSKEQAKEIDELLKKGAYDVFREDDDKDAQLFMEETDIDKLLERSSTKVTYGTGNTSLSSGLGSFNKASFVASGEGEGKDVDLDDPDFWEKAVGLQAPPDPAFDELAQLMTDGKRNRKQVQQYDPYADDKAAEVKKQEKIAEIEREEEEEKEIRRLAKFLARQDKKDRRRKRKREEAEARERERLASGGSNKEKKKHHIFGSHMSSRSEADQRASRESKSKRSRKAERRRALRRAEKEDPVLERIRQAWEVPHRNRATSAALRFGFGRFSKIRQESNLTSLPLQDMEVFVRAYLYQLGVQASVSLTDASCPNGATLKSMVTFIYNQYGPKDGDWICNAMNSSLTMFEEVENRSRFLRLPLVLADPDYVAELRTGAALRALRRFAFLSRVNAIVEKALDCVLPELGYEELGRRGCSIQDLSSLDLDLKARHVSTEELSHALGTYLACQSATQHHPLLPSSSIAPWWDRSCDIGLIVGTFIHGLGNYEAMRNDDELPFSRRITSFIAFDPASAQAHACFYQATRTAKNVYIEALKTAKRRQQIESHEAVAAVIAASKEGGECGEASNGNAAGQSDIAGHQKSEIAKDVDNFDTITLRRLSRAIVLAIRDKSASLHEMNGSTGGSSAVVLSLDKKKLGCHPHRCLPMPDALFLDSYLHNLVDSIDCSQEKSIPQIANEELQSTDVVDSKVDSLTKTAIVNAKIAAAGIGRVDGTAIAKSFRGALCGSHHKSLIDHSDYGHGAASSDLSSLATGADSSRYQRGPCVPLYLTRYSICSLIYADVSVVDVSCEARRAEDKLAKCKRAKEVANRAVPPPTNNEKGNDLAKTSSAGDAATDITMKTDARVNGDNFEDNDSRSKSCTAAEVSSKTAAEEVVRPPEKGEKTKVENEPGHGCVYAIPTELLEDTEGRAGLCIALLKSGSPATKDDAFQQASQNISRAVCTQAPDVDIKTAFFDTKSLADEAARLAGNAAQSLHEASVKKYIDEALLPHCLRLCMEGEVILSDEPSQQLAVGSIGLSSKNARSPIPDPWLPLEMHSEEAIRHASAILRRVRLMKAVRFIAGGGVPFDDVNSTLRSSLLRTSFDGLPIWWCPWIHDFGLLLHVATHGLAGITNRQPGNRDAVILRTPCFENGAVQKHIRSVFIEGKDGNPPTLPAQLQKSSSSQDIDAWVRLQASLLPSGKVLERRIALICGEMTKEIPATIVSPAEQESKEKSHPCRYDHIPMFDLGGWPMNG